MTYARVEELLIGERSVKISVLEDAELMKSLRNVIGVKWRLRIEEALLVGIAVHVQSDDVTAFDYCLRFPLNR